MAVIRHNERSRFKLEFKFLDEQNQPMTPNTCRWRVYCLSSDTDVTDWMDIAVPSTGVVEVTMLPSYLANLSGLAEEMKIVSIEGEYGTDDQVSQEQEILVKNLVKTV